MQRLAILTASFFALLGIAWALSSPVGSSPDDDFHLASIWCAWGNRTELCEVTSHDPITADVPSAIAAVRDCRMATVGTLQNCSTARSNSVSWLNEGLYPTHFYAALGTFASTNVLASTLVMRIINVLLASLILGVALALAPARLARAYLLAFMIGTVPLGLYLIASTNPSGWTVSGAAGLWVFAGTWLATDGSSSRKRRFVLVIALLLTTAMITARADGALLAFAILGAVLTMAREPLRPRIPRLWPFAIILAWSAFTLLTSSQVMVHASGMKGEGSGSTGYGAFAPALDATPGQILIFNLQNFPTLVTGAFGSGRGTLGWLDVLVPPVTSFVMVLLLGGVLLIGLMDVWRQKAVATSLLLVPLVLFPLIVLQRGGNVVGQSVQSRYLLPALIVVVAVWLASRHQTPAWPWNRNIVRAIAAGLVIALVLAYGALVSFYQWSPPPMSIALMVPLAIGVTVGYCICAVKTLSRFIISCEAEG